MGQNMPELNRDIVAHAIDQWIIGRNGERESLPLYYKLKKIYKISVSDEPCTLFKLFRAKI